MRGAGLRPAWLPALRDRAAGAGWGGGWSGGRGSGVQNCLRRPGSRIAIFATPTTYSASSRREEAIGTSLASNGYRTVPLESKTSWGCSRGSGGGWRLQLTPHAFCLPPAPSPCIPYPCRLPCWAGVGAQVEQYSWQQASLGWAGRQPVVALPVLAPHAHSHPFFNPRAYSPARQPRHRCHAAALLPL